MRAQEKSSTGKQRKLIHILARNIGLEGDEYRDWLLDNFDVNSSVLLSSTQASRAINMLNSKQPAAEEFEEPWEEKVREWNESITSRGAWQGLAVGGPPPEKRKLRHICGMLWEVSQKAENPINYARAIIKTITGEPIIRTQDQVEKLIQALIKRSRRQGRPLNETIRRAKQ